MAPVSDTCPLCGARNAAKTIHARFADKEHGHLSCASCRATYDSDIAEVRAAKIDADVIKSIDSLPAYQDLFVEKWSIADERGELYSAFDFDTDQLRRGVAGFIIRSIEVHCAMAEPRILDVGCGNGFTTTVLAERFGRDNVIGIDPSSSVSTLAKERIAHFQGTLETVRFPDERFDVVAIIGNLMLHRDMAATLRETFRIMKPGGLVIFDFKNIRCGARRLALLLSRLSPRLARSPTIQRNFVNMRYGLSRHHLPLILGEFEPIETLDKPPRLLAFRNGSAHQRGLSGLVWRTLNLIDQAVGEQAWLQVTARKPELSPTPQLDFDFEFEVARLPKAA